LALLTGFPGDAGDDEGVDAGDGTGDEAGKV
jgi:hypothetical protein